VPDFMIWSAPEEPYETHIRLCLESWNELKIRFGPTLIRLFQMGEDDVLEGIEAAIVCHDIGKLSYQWQDYIHKRKEDRKFGPPHATLGASYLLLITDNNPSSLSNASALAILMHHTDSGLAYGNLEHPAEDAINRGLVEYGTGSIRWSEGAENAFRQSFGDLSGFNLIAKGVNSVTLKHLETMAKLLRVWARCPKEIERHQRRLQTLAVHHILKVCDWRAAFQRLQIEVDEDEEGEKVAESWHQSILKVYLDGGLLS